MSYPAVSYPVTVAQFPDFGRPSVGIPTTSPVAAIGSPATRLYPDEPDSAADILDAADGVFDGKYFGMKILSSTKADRYLSPTKSPSYSGGIGQSTLFLPDANGKAPYPEGHPHFGLVSAATSSLPSPAPFLTTPNGAITNGFYPGIMPGSLFPPPASFSTSLLPPATFTTTSSASLTNTILPAFATQFDSASLTNSALPLSSSFPITGPPYPATLSASILSTATLPPATPNPAVYNSSPAPGTSFVGSTSISSPILPSLAPGQATPGVAEIVTPMKSTEGGSGSTINISNTGWEKAVDDLKRDVESLKAEGGMAALRDLLQMKVEELEKVRQSELVKEKELHRLQDMYAEEIRKHTEDLARVRKAEADLAALRQAEADRLRAQQIEQERAAAEALAKLQALRDAEGEAAKAQPKPKRKKKAKKAAKNSSKRSPIKVIR
eukprot:GGOE01008252.1.p1 GENE.GGOE01008252.1~~GGOE01008252.1.p1  ORF type:complete len:449 (-),score=106.83 GGOE01008252.1:186-1502(-)